MKKKNWFFKLGLSAVFLAISFVAATASCSTKSSKPQKAKKASRMTYANTTFDNAVGDSIQTIMMYSKVVAMLTTTDSLKAQPIQLVLSREDTQVIAFLGFRSSNVYRKRSKLWRCNATSKSSFREVKV